MGNVEYSDKIKILKDAKPAIDDTIQVKVDSIIYPNRLETEKADLAEQLENFYALFPWLERLPDLISLLITSCAFCLLGSLIMLFLQVLRKTTKLEDENLLLIAITGFLTGFVVLGLSYLIPLVVVRDEKMIRPISLMFFSLFAGLYSNRFYEKVSGYVETMFGKEKDA